MRYTNLDILRSIAASGVVLFHLWAQFKADGVNLGALSNLYIVGAAGVDVFFVISGFVIYLTFNRKRPSVGTFFLKRAFRIIPIYWLLTLFAVIVSKFLFGFTEPMEKIISSMLFVNNFFGMDYPVLYPGWSLNFEWLFYLVFALNIGINALTKKPAFILTVFTLLFIVSLAQANPRILEFALGMAIAKLRERRGIARLGAPAILLGAVLLIAPPITNTALPGFFNQEFIYWGIPAALLVFGAVNIKQTKARFWVKLGNASYAAYLIQYESLRILGLAFHDVGMTPQTVLFRSVLTLIVTWSVAIFLETYLDSPLRRRLENKFLFRPKL